MTAGGIPARQPCAHPEESEGCRCSQDYLRYLIQPEVCDPYQKTAVAQNIPCVPSIVTEDPAWLDPKHRTALKGAPPSSYHDILLAAKRIALSGEVGCSSTDDDLLDLRDVSRCLKEHARHPLE